MLVLRGSQTAHCAEYRLMSQEIEASSSFCEHDVRVEFAFLQFYTELVSYTVDCLNSLSLHLDYVHLRVLNAASPKVALLEFLQVWSCIQYCILGYFCLKFSD